MQSLNVERSLLYERIQACRADFDHLLQTLESPVATESGSTVGLLRRLVNPITHWDIWHLPLVAHDYAYFIVQHGEVEGFQSFIEAEVKRVQRLTTNDPPSSEEMLPFLPEVRDAQKARQDTDVAAFEDQMGPV